jgi:hypothetical protein
MPPLESILQFPNPNTPDLGCFVRRKHEFETDQDVDFQNVHVELNPSIDFSPSHHQVYFRVMCGEAAFFQRCLVYMTANVNLPPPVLQSFPPDFVLGGDYTPRPSEWSRFPTQTGERFYWFFGQHRNPAVSTWQADALVGHSYDIYENGTLSIVRYDDTGGDRDFDDLVLEVAVVGRRSWIDLIQAENQVAINKKIQKEGLPRLRSLLERRGHKAASPGHQADG